MGECCTRCGKRNGGRDRIGCCQSLHHEPYPSCLYRPGDRVHPAGGECVQALLNAAGTPHAANSFQRSGRKRRVVPFPATPSSGTPTSTWCGSARLPTSISAMRLPARRRLEVTVPSRPGPSETSTVSCGRKNRVAAPSPSARTPRGHESTTRARSPRLGPRTKAIAGAPTRGPGRGAGLVGLRGLRRAGIRLDGLGLGTRGAGGHGGDESADGRQADDRTGGIHQGRLLLMASAGVCPALPLALALAFQARQRR